MLTIPSYFVKLAQAILLRVAILLFFYLSLIFVRMFIAAGSHAHPYIGVICPFFYEVVGVVIFQLLYGKHSVGRDINTLSVFGLLFTAVYLACYFAGIDIAVAQNYVAKGLNFLIVLRCFYFPEHDLLKAISPIGAAKRWIEKRHWFVSSYLNTLTVFVFAFCAVPLFTMMYLINTDEMRASGIAVILFAFYIAFEKSNAQTIPQQNNEVISSPPVRLDKATQDELAKANEINFELNFWLRTFLVILGIIAIGLIASIKFYKVSFFDAGYSTGFSDAKSGAAPKRETNFQKALECIEVNRSHFPAPSDAGCPPPAKPWR